MPKSQDTVAEQVEPSWLKQPLRSFRVFITLLALLIIAVSLEIYLRIAVVPWYSSRDARWVEIWNRMTRFWGVSSIGVVKTVLGMKIRVEGNVPSTGRYVMVANHQSSVDIPALMTVFRDLDLKYVANDGLLHGKPGVSLALRNGGFASVGKVDRDKDMEALRNFAKGLAHYRASAVIFPEGRRPDDSKMLPFHFGGTELVTRVSGLSIIPVTHDGLWRARSLKGFRGLIGTTVTFRVLEPVPFEQFEKAPWETLEEIERTIRRNLDDMRNRDSDQAPDGQGQEESASLEPQAEVDSGR